MCQIFQDFFQVCAAVGKLRKGRLLCLTQPDHAALAGRLADAWAADGFPGRRTRDRVIEAVR